MTIIWSSLAPSSGRCQNVCFCKNQKQRTASSSSASSAWFGLLGAGPGVPPTHRVHRSPLSPARSQQAGHGPHSSKLSTMADPALTHIIGTGREWRQHWPGYTRCHDDTLVLVTATQHKLLSTLIAHNSIHLPPFCLALAVVISYHQHNTPVFSKDSLLFI